MYKHLTRKSYAADCTVLHNRQIGGEAWVMGIRCPEVASRSKPGHFVMITVEKGIHPVLPRPFSIYRLLDSDGGAMGRPPEPAGGGDGIFWRGVSGFDVLYKVVGDGTERLARKEPGDTVGIMGPCGDGLYAPVFKDDRSPAFVLLVSGGVGIVPLYFSAIELAARGVPTYLFFGGRSREYLYDIDLFPPLGTKVFAATEDGSFGEKGLVTHVLGRFLEEGTARGVGGRPLREGAIYACGPEAMLRVVQKIAAHHAVPSHLSLERRMGCAMGACRGCVVRIATPDGSPAYQRVCTEGPVFAGSEVIL
ncbi:MAG: dihydroorotate dehydrogenase electron transfer subunit [Acidobacteriota bacterium]